MYWTIITLRTYLSMTITPVLKHTGQTQSNMHVTVMALDTSARSVRAHTFTWPNVLRGVSLRSYLSMTLPVVKCILCSLLMFTYITSRIIEYNMTMLRLITSYYNLWILLYVSISIKYLFLVIYQLNYE